MVRNLEAADELTSFHENGAVCPDHSGAALLRFAASVCVYGCTLLR